MLSLFVCCGKRLGHGERGIDGAAGAIVVEVTVSRGNELHEERWGCMCVHRHAESCRQ